MFDSELSEVIEPSELTGQPKHQEYQGRPRRKLQFEKQLTGSEQLVTGMEMLKIVRRPSEQKVIQRPACKLPVHADIMKIHLHVGDNVLLDPKCNIPKENFTEWRSDQQLPYGLVLDPKTGVVSGTVTQFTSDFIFVTIKCKYFDVPFDVIRFVFTVDPNKRVLNKLN